MKNKAKRKVKNQKNSGQITVEYILLAVVLITLFQVVSNVLKENDYLKNFQDVPGRIFVNLVENGNWKMDYTESRNLHPNQHNLHFTPDGKGP